VIENELSSSFAGRSLRRRKDYAGTFAQAWGLNSHDVEPNKGSHTVKNTIKVLVVALTSLAFNGLSFAQAKPATPATPAAPTIEKKSEMKSEKAQATVLTGRVTSVDAKTGKLTVKTKDKEVNLTTDSKTTKAALEKLKVGDTAKVFERGGTVIAASPVKAESKTKAAK
jgi:Cu/Ag efflux protein CusF